MAIDYENILALTRQVRCTRQGQAKGTSKPLELYGQDIQQKGSTPYLSERKIGHCVEKTNHHNQHTGGKFKPISEGPFVNEKVSDGGAYQLVDMKGKRLMPPINGRFLKKYYA